MSASWPCLALSAVCREITDGSHFSPATCERGYPYVTVRDIVAGEIDLCGAKRIDQASYDLLVANGCKPETGDVLFSKDGTVGKVALVRSENPFVVLSSLAILRPDSTRVNSAYLAYALRDPALLEIALGRKTGVAIKRIILKNLKSLTIPVPPLAEQQRIVAILDEAFEGIEAAVSAAKETSARVGRLFDAVLMSTFNGLSEQSPLQRLDALTETPITYGVVKPGAEGPVRFVRGGDILDGRIRLDRLRTITDAVSAEYRRTLLRGGELLICLVGQPGQVAVAPPSLRGANIARQVGLIRLNAGLDPEYVRLFLRSPIGQEALGAKQSGSVQQVINLSELKDVEVPVLPFFKQSEVVARLLAVAEEIETLKDLTARKLAALDELKQSLLARAFSGELTREPIAA